MAGAIAGTGPEEVLTLGHTSEQGAEDNATGVAATIEALATLQRLIIQLTRLELGPTEFDFVGYFRFLARRGYVEISE